MLGEHLRDTHVTLFAVGMCRNSFGPCALRMRPEHAGDEELRLRELLAEHRHERDRAAFAHIGRRRAERASREARSSDVLEPRRERAARASPAALVSGSKRDLSRRTADPPRAALQRRRRRAAASSVGGMRSESLSVVYGRSTLPALAGGGSRRRR